MRTTLTTIAAAAALATAAPVFAAPVQVAPAAPVADSGLVDVQYREYRGCYRGERAYDCRERLRYEQQYNRSYRYDNGRYYYDNNQYNNGYSNRNYYRNDSGNQAGAAIIGGIIGFALGAAIAGNDDDRRYYNSNRANRRYHSWCRSRYRSYDYNTGTYLGSDGYRRYCRMR